MIVTIFFPYALRYLLAETESGPEINRSSRYVSALLNSCFSVAALGQASITVPPTTLLVGLEIQVFNSGSPTGSSVGYTNLMDA